MKAEVISIGTELLLGDITDTNATHIAQELRRIGLDLFFRTTVGDNEERIASAIDLALSRVDVVITTGGLGPTVDDVTREAIARATGRPLEFHQVLLDQIAERFRRFGVQMTDNNRKQAYAPAGARLIENPVGTAPIFILETERGAIMVLPGVPREMEYLLANEVIPWLKTAIGAPSVILSLVLRTVGIGESQVDSRIADLMTMTNPTVGLAAHAGQTDIRITAKAPTDSEAKTRIIPVENDIRRRVGEWIYATGDEPIEKTSVDLLAQKGYSLGIVEVGTGGLLGKRLAEATQGRPGILIGTEEARTPTGSLKDASEYEAQTVKDRYHATHGVAAFMQTIGKGGEDITGVAVAVATPSGCRSRVYSWTAERVDAPIWVTTHALALLWRTLSNLEKPDAA